jgi:hypothetical protein
MWMLSFDHLFDAAQNALANASLFDAAQNALANGSLTEVLVVVAVVWTYVMFRVLRV